MSPQTDRAIREAPLPGSYVLAIDTRTQAGREAVRGIVKGLCEGAVPHLGLEATTKLAVSRCGPEFGDFLANRYGGRVAEAVASTVNVQNKDAA